MTTPLRLLPSPRSLPRSGGEVACPTTLAVAGADAALLAVTLGGRGRPSDAADANVVCTLSADGGDGAEGYRLEIGAKPFCTITARTRTGLRWALATLAQIVGQCGGTPQGKVPQLRIDDAPAFPIRGAMLDISRDRVPTMATLRELVTKLGSWKINHLELYTEHTFAYRGHEAVWHASSPITPEEMRELDALCTVHGIALTANQNCLGHVERWLKVPSYAHLGERASGWLVHGHWYCDPNTLVANDPAGLALVKDLLDQLIPCCSGDYVHIGCDEPWDLGSERSKAAVAKDGFHGVYTKHVSTVATYVRSHGKRPVYWSDADHAKPEIAALLPSDIVPLVWGYGPETEFAKRGRLFRDRGLETWVAPGTNNWGSFLSRTFERRGNLARAAREGAEIGCVGYLNTEWGDSGHRQQWPLTVAGFADGAQSSWRGDHGFDDAALGLHAFGIPALGRWLVELGDADRALREQGTSTFVDAHVPIFEPNQPGDVAAWTACGDKLKSLEASLPVAEGLLADECRHAAQVARWACDRAVVRRGKPELDARKGLANRLAELLGEHRRLWLERSRYGGLEQSSDQYRRQIWSY
jgi:hypothetical protein